MSGVIPDWMREQKRVEELLGTSANGYGSANPEAPAWNTFQGDPAFPQTNAGSPFIPYDNYFQTPAGQPTGAQFGTDPSIQKLMPVAQASAALQTAFNSGDGQGYAAALQQYKAITGGFPPDWARNITPEMVQANAKHGVDPQNTPYTGPTQQPTPFTYGGAPGGGATPPASGGQPPNRMHSLAIGGQQSAERMPPEDLGGGVPPGGRQPGASRTGNAPPRIGGAPAAGIGVTGSSGGYGGSTGTPSFPQGPVQPTDPSRNVPPANVSPRPGQPSPTSPTPIGGSDPTGRGGVGTTTTPNPTGGSGRSPGVSIGGGGPVGSPYTPPSSSSVPLPNDSYTKQAFPNWATWNGGAPYTGGDPGMMATSESNRAIDYGNLFQNQFGNAYGDARAREDAYRGAADTSYDDLYQNPGFNASEADTIQNGGIRGGLNSLRASDSDLASNYLTDAEQAGIKGNPNSIYDAFNPDTLNDIARAGTGATKGFFDRNYQTAQDALNSGSGRMDATLAQYGTGARGALGTMRSDLQGAIDPTKLGISNEEVERIKSQAGRQVGAQYGTAIDQLQRQAEAAGNVSPLALSAARDRLLRSQAIDSANAVTQADLQAREKQRAAEQDISTRRIGVGTTIGNAGIGLEGDIANTGLNANQSMAGLQAGTAATYGGLGTNLGLNTTKQLTDAATKAGETKLGQAQYVDTNTSNRANTVAQNRQATSIGNQGTRYSQGMGVGDANTRNATTIGNARIAGRQAARNYWAGAGQFQGGQANAAAGQQLTGAQTSLSGMGQGGSTAVGNINARKNPITLGGIGFTL